MKERPILFSGPMVKAILEGRKTQTRRVVKNPGPLSTTLSPYGVPGDRLWVRETWGHEADGNACDDIRCGNPDHIWYRASEKDPSIFPKDFWRPSIHMPRWASRLTLEVTAVRVQRLNELDKWDAKAEGIDPTYPNPIASFSALWDSINGKKHPWSSNPVVRVVEFRKIDA